MKIIFFLVTIFSNVLTLGQNSLKCVKLQEVIWENNIGAVCYISMIPEKHQYEDTLKINQTILFKYVNRIR
jgi:hypothetical protein